MMTEPHRVDGTKRIRIPLRRQGTRIACADRVRMRRLGWFCALALLIVLPAYAWATPDLDVTLRIGFRTLGQGAVVRHGTWVPVVVDIDLINNSASFDGSVRVAQYDTDGDESYDLVDVHLMRDTREHQQVTLYVVANPSRNRGRFVVEVLNDQGEIVEVLCQSEPTHRVVPLQQPSPISHDDLLILSIYDGAIGRVGDLTGASDRPPFERNIHVAHMSPTDLPELWIGLEAIDYIVWDDAHPEVMTSRQVAALIEWVRQGGTLLMAASRSAGSLAMTSGIDKLLPVEIGDISIVDDLRLTRNRLLDADLDTGFAEPVPVVRCTLRAGAMAIEPGRGIEEALLSRGRVDRGHVIFSGITLRDLFSGETGEPAEFFRRVFHLGLLDANAQPTPRPLFADIVSSVSFTTSAGLYLFVAGAFSLIYLFVATTGTWWFLGRRGARRHAWSAFAIVAIGATLLSVAAVQSLHGFGEQLHQLTIIDLDAGETRAYATVFFGLKTSSDKQVDVWLPSDPLMAMEPGPTNCTLRPLPPGNDLTESTTGFVDPGPYRLVPASAAIDNVRIRATLKRFEGRWKGPVGGTLTGQITIRKKAFLEEDDEKEPAGEIARRNEMLDGTLEPTSKRRKASSYDWRLTEDSFVVNNLGVDLVDCYLLHTIRNTDGPGSVSGKRGDAIYAYPIGLVPAGGQKTWLAPQCYRLSGSQTVLKAMRTRTLEKQQTAWSAPFRGSLSRFSYGAATETGLLLGEEDKALLLLSTIGEFDPTKGAGAGAYFGGLITWSRDRLRQLDLSSHLQRDSVHLIGFADDAGPVRLFTREGNRRYRRVEPDPRNSRTMYRIRIPAVVDEELSLEQGEAAKDETG